MQTKSQQFSETKWVFSFGFVFIEISKSDEN